MLYDLSPPAVAQLAGGMCEFDSHLLYDSSLTSIGYCNIFLNIFFENRKISLLNIVNAFSIVIFARRLITLQYNYFCPDLIVVLVEIIYNLLVPCSIYHL